MCDILCLPALPQLEANMLYILKCLTHDCKCCILATESSDLLKVVLYKTRFPKQILISSLVIIPHTTPLDAKKNIFFFSLVNAV